MPELPEVETTRAGIEPHLLNQQVAHVEIRQPRLRWPVDPRLPERLHKATITAVRRRGKYLLLHVPDGVLLIHLGMSGSLRITAADTPLRKHDHFLVTLASGRQMRLHDPRRFGAVLWWDQDPASHPLLASLGPEPLSGEFSGDYLHATCHSRRTAIKQHIMNSKIVVGVGNIYASEALFLAGIHPNRQAGRVSRARCDKLADAIEQVLLAAIEQGGSTLRDFVREDGQPGYFKQYLNVYDREGQPCPNCQAPIRKRIIGQRSTYYCVHCQH